MKSKIEVRVFAVEKAISVMGIGTPDKDVIAKAKEIEAYVIGEAELPDVYDEANAYTNVVGNLLGNVLNT